MNISDILRHKSTGTGADVLTLAPGDTVTDLLAALAERNVGAALALDGDEVVGIASERDIVRHLARRGAAVLDEPVSEIMTAVVHTCTSDDSIDAIAEVMTERHIRHMPVVVDGGRLAGIVSIGDVVSSHIRQLEHDRGQLEQYINS